MALLSVGLPAGLFALLTTDFIEKAQQPANLPALGYIAFLGFSSTAVATVIFNRMVKITSPVFASSTTYIIPAVAVAWGLADGEKLAWQHFVGLGSVIAGVLLVNLRRKG